MRRSGSVGLRRAAEREPQPVLRRPGAWPPAAVRLPSTDAWHDRGPHAPNKPTQQPERLTVALAQRDQRSQRERRNRRA
jgi:hypothetical protein